MQIQRLLRLVKWKKYDYKILELPHDKTNKVAVRPAKTQISLGIRPVWSESLLCAQSVAKDPSFLHVDSEDSDQTGADAQADQSLCWAHNHIVGFVMRRLTCIHQVKKNVISCLLFNMYLFYHKMQIPQN